MTRVEKWIKKYWIITEDGWISGKRFGVLFYGISVVLLSILLGSLILLVNGYSPLEAYRGIIIGSLGSWVALSETLTRTTPLIFTGLAVAIPRKAGLFNIGGEGQLMVGALAAAIVGASNLGLPPAVHIGLSLLAGIACGAIWASLVGYIKVSFGAHEVITTIMMNYIAALLTGYLVNYPWKAAESMVAQTEFVQPSAELLRLFPGGQLSIGLFMAIVSAFACGFILKRTVFGFELRAVGHNPGSAETSGISATHITIFAMIFAGALAGLGGGIEALGVHHQFIDGMSPGLGFDGVAVALVANSNPHAILLTALLFGALKTGGIHLDRTTSLPGDFGTLIQGLVIIFVAAPKMFIYLSRRRS